MKSSTWESDHERRIRAGVPLVFQVAAGLCVRRRGKQGFTVCTGLLTFGGYRHREALLGAVLGRAVPDPDPHDAPISEHMRAKTDQPLMTAPVSSGAVALVLRGADGVRGRDLPDACRRLCALAVCGRRLGAGRRELRGAASARRRADRRVPVLSSLTESQLIAAVGGFLVSILLILLETLAPLVSNPLIKQVFQWSTSSRYTPFILLGRPRLENAVFFVSVAALFVLLTVMRLERRRWS